MSRSRYTTPQNRTTSLLPRFAEVESGAFTHRMTDSTRSATTSSILTTRSTSLFSRPPRSTGPGPSDIVHNPPAVRAHTVNYALAPCWTSAAPAVAT